MIGDKLQMIKITHTHKAVKYCTKTMCTWKKIKKIKRH